jgi:hypothetical protein
MHVNEVSLQGSSCQCIACMQADSCVQRQRTLTRRCCSWHWGSRGRGACCWWASIWIATTALGCLKLTSEAHCAVWSLGALADLQGNADECVGGPRSKVFDILQLKHRRGTFAWFVISEIGSVMHGELCVHAFPAKAHPQYTQTFLSL